jgi:hypothetical protein
VTDVVKRIVDNLSPLREDPQRVASEVRKRLDEARLRVDEVKAIPTPAETRAKADGIERCIPALEAHLERLTHVEAVAASMIDSAIKQLRAAVAVLRSRSGGLSGHVNRVALLCAAVAYDLHEFSERRPTGYEDGSFRTTTALVHEAVTGHEAGDLRRACESEIRRRRR